MTDRVVVLIDMDCFYCQVESRLDPALQGRPTAVVQYNAWKGGGIIAVSYEARAFGVRRGMRGDEARERCGDIALVSVPEVREKADLTRYRDAGKEVIQVLLQFKGAVVERASVDEAYLDITRMVQERMEEKGKGSVTSKDVPNTHIVGIEEGEEEEEEGKLHGDWLKRALEENQTDNVRLAVGAAIVEEMRRAIFDQTRFRCSAGVAHNKTLAKLACGIHKPNKQTILPHEAVDDLFRTLKVTKLRGLGGKLGAVIEEELNCETVGDLSRVDLSQLKERFEEKTATWLYHIARGVEGEPVRERDLPKSIGCSKNFPGTKSLDTRERVHFWFSQLSEEVCERLEKDRESNGRVARGLTVHLSNDRGASSSKAGPLGSYDPEKMTRQAMLMVGSLNESVTSDPSLWRPRVTNLSISAGKFAEESGQTPSIQNFFGKKDSSRKEDDIAAVDVEELVPTLEGFDQSILQLLPAKIKRKVHERLEKLRGEEASSSEGASASSSGIGEVHDHDHDQAARDVPQQEGDKAKCDKCGKFISEFELPEHLDFHMAKELQAEMSRQERPIATRMTETVQPSSSSSRVTKRKKGAAAGLPNVKCKKQRDITNFLKKI